MSIKRKNALLKPPAPVVDLAEILKSLVQLSRAQGHLTDDDINDLVPTDMADSDVEELHRKLRDFDIKVIGLSEVEQPKPAEADEEVEPRLDTLDDPVQMHE